MKAIFIAGTAGSGKSALVTRIKEHYTKSGSFAAVLNLDPGVEDTPYAPDVDIREADTINPDYLIVDTPGQIELFAYRSSGPYITENLIAEEKVGIFMYDGKLITDPTNFVSISMLATSIRLRLGLPMINLLSKQDLITDMVGEIIKWSSNLPALENAIASSTDGESYAGSYQTYSGDSTRVDSHRDYSHIQRYWRRNGKSRDGFE